MRPFEELQVGDRFETAELALSEADIIAFGCRYDPQPFHTDPAAAGHSLFGRLVASGWHTAAVSMRLMVESGRLFDGGVIGQGLDFLRWPRPVYPGDRLHVVAEVIEKSALAARPTHGSIKLRCRTCNQDGKVVQEMTAALLVARRGG